MKFPANVEDLNQWLSTRFNTLKEAKRAYLEFPFSISFNAETVYFQHRIVFITLAYEGAQARCCKQIATDLTTLSVTHEALLDQNELLFIRNPFQLDKHEPGVYRVAGRLAFWNNRLNEELRKLPCAKLQGAYTTRLMALEEE